MMDKKDVKILLIEDDDIDIDFALRDVTHIVDMWKIRNALAAMINTLATFVIDD